MTQPTTQEINQRLVTAFQAEFNQVIPLLPVSFLRVLAKILAGVFTILGKQAGFFGVQYFARLASFKATEINGESIIPLVELGVQNGTGAPVPGTQAQLLVDITVNVQSGSIPSGQQLIKTETQVVYLTVGDTLLNNSTVQATIRAVSDPDGNQGRGVIGNLDPLDTLSFVATLPNVEQAVVVNSQVVTGANDETEEAYRQRVLDRFQKVPQGGAYADYELWGEEVAGIINVYPYTGDPGEVDVFAEATPASSGSPDGIPTAAQLQAVFDSIELNEAGLATRRPANAFVNVFAITRTGFDVRITGLMADNLAELQAQITDAITQFFLSAEPFVPGLTIPPRKDRILRSALIGLIEDLTTAANGEFTTATFDLTGLVGSQELYVLAEGEKAKLVNITFF